MNAASYRCYSTTVVMVQDGASISHLSSKGGGAQHRTLTELTIPKGIVIC